MNYLYAFTKEELEYLESIDDKLKLKRDRVKILINKNLYDEDNYFEDMYFLFRHVHVYEK